MKCARLWKDLQRHSPQLHDTEATRTQRTQWQKHGDNDLARRQLVHSESLKIDNQDGHSERHASTPEDIGCDDGPKHMLRVGQDFGDNTTGCCSNNRCNYWQQPRRCHGGELSWMQIHTIEAFSRPNLDC